jgi:NAD(P)H-hydrate epimerase
MNHVTSGQMRALEQAAIESGLTTGLALMERAGEGALEAILSEWTEFASPGRAVVLCGPGNNGGDGFVVARLLRARGWNVAIFFYGDSEWLPPDARRNRERWLERDGARISVLSFPRVREEEVRALEQAACTPPVDLVVDALFGIGLTRPISGLAPVVALNAASFANPGDERRPRYVAIDLPSGLGDDGPLPQAPDLVLRADLTVTFHAAKTAHAGGAEWCGRIVVCDIGL